MTVRSKAILKPAEALKHLKALEQMGCEFHVIEDSADDTCGLFIALPHFTNPDECQALLNEFEGPVTTLHERTPAEWLDSPRFAGIEVLDPTGWQDCSFDDEIDIAGFTRRLLASTIRFTG